MRKTILFIAAILLSQLVVAQNFKTVTSPNENVQFSVFTNPWGVPGYYVIAEGDTLISDSQLGLKYSGSEATGHRIDKVNYRWMQTDTLNNKLYNEMIVTILQPYKGTLKVYARAYDNAIAIKQGYVVDSAEKVFLQDDNTCITFSKKSMQNGVPVDSLKEISLPAEFELSNGKVMTVLYSKQEDYPEISLTTVENMSNMLKVNLKPMYEGNDHIVSVQPGSFASPYIYIEIKE